MCRQRVCVGRGACRQRDCASSVNMQAEGVCRQCEHAGRGSVQAEGVHRLGSVQEEGVCRQRECANSESRLGSVKGGVMGMQAG